MASQGLLEALVQAVSGCLGVIAEGREVQVRLVRSRDADISELPSDFLGPSVLAVGEVRSSKGADRAALLFHVPDALIYVGLMLGLDRAAIEGRLAEGFTADDSDAFGEAMNQCFGQIGPVASRALGEEVSSVHRATGLVDLATDGLGSHGLTQESTYSLAELEFLVEGYASSGALLFWPTHALAGRPSEKPTGPAWPPPLPTSAPGVPVGGQHPYDRRRVLKIELPLTVLLADKQMSMKDVFALTPGSIIEFSKSSEDYLHLLAGDRKFAEGEAAKTGDKFCFQVRRLAQDGAGRKRH